MKEYSILTFYHYTFDLYNPLVGESAAIFFRAFRSNQCHAAMHQIRFLKSEATIIMLDFEKIIRGCFVCQYSIQQLFVVVWHKLYTRHIHEQRDKSVAACRRDNSHIFYHAKILNSHRASCCGTSACRVARNMYQTLYYALHNTRRLLRTSIIFNALYYLIIKKKNTNKVAKSQPVKQNCSRINV